MPKVIHIIHESRGGGGMRIALDYFPRYQTDYETVAITGKLGPLPDQLRARGVRTYALPLDHLWRALASLPRLWWVLQKEKPDVVIVHGQWSGFCGALSAWLAGVQTVIYFTQMPSFYVDWDFYRIVRNRIVERTTCAIATRVVCLSQAGRYQYLLRRLVPEKNLLHIPNGVDLEQVRPVMDKAALRQDLQLPTDVPVVVSVGRLEDQKRVDWLVRAWQQVEAHHSTAQLFIVGDGRDRRELETLATKLGLKRCQFLGVQPDGYRFFQAADVGVMTSLFEGHPYALLEAMACGCPMVATAADGIPETIVEGETGFCVPVADTAALAEKILHILSHPDKSVQMGACARRRVEEKYALDSVVERQLALVKDVLREKA